MEILITNVRASTLAAALESLTPDSRGDIIVGYQSYDENGTLIHYRLRRQDELTYGTEIGSASLIFGSVASCFDIRLLTFLDAPITLAFIAALIRNK